MQALDEDAHEVGGDSDVISEQDSCEAESHPEEKEAGRMSTERAGEVRLEIQNRVFLIGKL